MFRVSFFCDDKKLADALRGLAGIATGAPEAQPVINGVAKNGKVVAAGEGSNSELFLKYAKAHGLTKFKSADLADFTKSVGMAPASRGYLLKQLTDAGVLKKHGAGTGTTYSVVTK